MLVVVEGHTACLERGTQKAKPVNKHGLKFQHSRVLSCNGGVLRRQLEDHDAEHICVHLCRSSPCEEAGMTHHSLAYTAVDADSIVDL